MSQPAKIVIASPEVCYTHRFDTRRWRVKIEHGFSVLVTFSGGVLSVAGLRKVKIDWSLLRSFDPTPLLTLEQELEEAVRQEYEARRAASMQKTKETKRRRRRGATVGGEPVAEEAASMPTS